MPVTPLALYCTVTSFFGCSCGRNHRTCSAWSWATGVVGAVEVLLEGSHGRLRRQVWIPLGMSPNAMFHCPSHSTVTLLTFHDITASLCKHCPPQASGRIAQGHACETGQKDGSAIACHDALERLCWLRAVL